MEITEKDIEECFKTWWELTYPKEWKLIGQQTDIGIGIIDLLYWNFTWDHPIVVEIKRGKAPKNVLAQLMSYMGHISEAINTDYKDETQHLQMDPLRATHGFIVAEELDGQTMRAIKVNRHLDFIKYSLKNNILSFSHEWLYPKDRWVYEMDVLKFMRKRIADREAKELSNRLRLEITNPNSFDFYEIDSIRKSLGR